MRLKYKILWVENDSDWAESIEDDLKEIVEDEYGFVLDKNLYSKQDEKIQYNDYDLILMDLNLDTKPTGDVLIKNIRDKEIYTDVIFYSADGVQKIKQKAQALDLEGVYFSGRDKELFLKKVKVVIQTTIRKVQDLNNLRGLVMAEVSELDAMMDDIIVTYFSDTNNGLREKFNEKVIKKDREKTYKKQLSPNPESACKKDCSLNWVNLADSDLIRVIDAYMKAHAMKHIIEFVNTQDADFDYNKYINEIINVRNNLAHCESQIVDGKEILKTRRGSVVFENEDFKRIRNDIRKYNQLFTKLRDYKNI